MGVQNFDNTQLPSPSYIVDERLLKRNLEVLDSVIGDYSFEKPLQAGDKLVFLDMAHYTMVKNHMFNGVNLPSIATYNEEEGIKVVRQFKYEDYSNRLS
ncbi:diaminopimelate decarboxylase [Paenibacillus brasilensis]|uniref:Diaminopimelate decarboxylase n=1 Tax=Paenibacillus brasilensis TaxID=128574 RepID=A0ABU0L5N2_9BACL|nr:diaminopimelate decarboxylase [Paenibacillus brasilensis]